MDECKATGGRLIQRRIAAIILPLAGEGTMRRVLGSAFVLLLALSAEAAACGGPGIYPIDNQTVDTTMQTRSGEQCRLHFHSSPGPLSGFAIVQRPSHGTASIGPFNVFYRARPGYVGSDSFIYERSGRTALGAPTVRKVRVAVTVSP
jgi:hypothetical protein